MNGDDISVNTFINEHITFDEVDSVVRKLKKKKAFGCDMVPNEVLKRYDVVQLLTVMMNVCMKLNMVPEVWKKSIIIPVPKSSQKDPHMPLNYRGISLLSCS